MRRRMFLPIAAVWALLAGGCGTAELDARAPEAWAAPQVAPPTAVAAAPSASVVPTAEPIKGNAMQPDSQSKQPLSLSQTQELAKADLAARLRVRADQIQVVASESRTWSDKGLGCAARKGMFEPEQVSGYRLVLAYGDQKFTYHTDQHGRLVRCREPGKRLGPVM